MPSARFWPAERIAASGVLSSWVTPATNSICWRARRRALCAPVARRTAGGAEEREDAEAHREIAPAHPRHGLLQRTARGGAPRAATGSRRRTAASAPLAGHRGPSSGRPLAEARAPASPVAVGAGSAAAAGQAALDVAGSRGAQPGQGIAREDDGPVGPAHDGHDELALRERVRSAPRRAGGGAARAGRRGRAGARTTPVEPEAVPTAGPAASRRRGVHEREGQGERRLEERARPDEEALPARQRPSPASDAAARAPASTGPRGTRARPRRRPRAGPRPRPRASRAGRPRGARACSSVRHAARRSTRSGARVAGRRARLHAEEGHDRPADLAVERAREPPRRALELRPAPLGLGPADLRDPPVLESSEHDEQHGERGQGQPQPAVLRLPAHDASVAAGRAGRRLRTLPLQALQRDCGAMKTARRGGRILWSEGGRRAGRIGRGGDRQCGR